MYTLTVLSKVLISHDMYDMDYIFDRGDCCLMTPLSGALGRLRDDDRGSQETFMTDYEKLYWRFWPFMKGGYELHF